VKPEARAGAALQLLPLAAAALKLKRERARLQPVAVPRFRGAALEAQRTTTQEWLLAGPAETGKTYAGLWYLDSLLRTTPKAKAAIVRKVRKDMVTTVLETWDRIVSIRGGVTRYGGRSVESFHYGNGARCFVAGLDDPGKVLSSELDWMYVNQAEQLQVNDWEYCTTRTTGRGVVTPTPMLFGDCNPGPPTHWILKRPRIKLLHSVHTDNPTLFDDDGHITAQGERSLATLQALTGVRRERLFRGKWVQAEGAVYDTFDRGVHVITREAFDKLIVTQWYEGIDFGYSNPFCWQRVALDGDGRMYLEREIYRTKRLVEDHAEEIKRYRLGRPPATAVADHDAEGRATLERRGIPTLPAFKSVSPGIQNLQARLAVQGDGKPRLYVVEDACEERDPDLAAAHLPTCSLEEFEVYSWPTAPDGRALREEPVKKFDHGMDTLRYIAAHVDGLAIEGTGEFVGELGQPAIYSRDESDEPGPGDELPDEGYR
jgi:phage terminase large subunit